MTAISNFDGDLVESAITAAHEFDSTEFHSFDEIATHLMNQGTPVDIARHAALVVRSKSLIRRIEDGRNRMKFGLYITCISVFFLLMTIHYLDIHLTIPIGSTMFGLAFTIGGLRTMKNCRQQAKNEGVVLNAPPPFRR